MLDRIQPKTKARFKDTIGLVRHTLTVFSKDADVIKPIIGMIVLNVLATGPIILGFALMLFASIGGVGSGTVGVLLFLFGLFVSLFVLFYDAFQRAKVSALSYAVIKGEDATIPQAKQQIKPIHSTLFLLGLIDSVIAYANNQRDSKGIGAIIVSILLFVLKEVWDLVSNFLLPAVVIEQKGPKDVVGELKELKRNVPAALMGALGFDAFGSVARTLVFGIYVGLGLVGIALPLIFFGANPVTLAVTLVTLTIIVIASAIITKMVIGAKTVYFTLFYMALVRPHEIDASMSEACTNLLPAEVAERTEQSGKPNAQLTALVGQLRARGGTDEQIRAFLIQRGFSEQDVDSALR